MSKNKKKIKVVHDFHSMLRKLDHRQWKCSKNKEKIGIPKKDLMLKKYEEKVFGSYSKIKAPKIFNLLKNPDEVLFFIEKLDKLFQNRKDTTSVS